MAPSGISLNKPAAITLIILITGGIILYRWKNANAATPEKSEIELQDGAKSTYHFYLQLSLFV
jgi:hypothetical protein